MAEPGKAVEDSHELAPGAAVAGKCPSACRCKTVKPSTPLARLLHPAAFHQELPLQAIQERVERRHVKLQLVLRLGFDQLGELVSMSGAPFEQRQDDHFGAALLQVAGPGYQHSPYLWIIHI